jgi:hypothetical protein
MKGKMPFGNIFPKLFGKLIKRLFNFAARFSQNEPYRQAIADTAGR